METFDTFFRPIYDISKGLVLCSSIVQGMGVLSQEGYIPNAKFEIFGVLVENGCLVLSWWYSLLAKNA
jgi:hypothetical protein